MQDVSSQGGGSSGGGGGATSSSIIIRSVGQQSDNNKSIPSAADLSYYGHQQSPNSLSNQTSWHSEMDHGELQNRLIIYSRHLKKKKKKFLGNIIRTGYENNILMHIISLFHFSL